ncbi:MAG: transglutaminase domain-containing protein [Bacteroidales bacterium]|jgi:transglutaminase-like putative cysteine protease|nr:transglutaminase domain-containing protein [Bacteroidales bacterium]
MKYFHLFLSLVILLASCDSRNTHFLKDEQYRNQVNTQFEKRKSQASGRQQALFSVLDRPHLSTEQREALQFLYAYMPLSDLADYDGDFFLHLVDEALRIRDYFPWCKTIPDDIFRHFVLVYRINNENLDDARSVFFDELKERVKNLSMQDAALEVNQWCREKVSYSGTDPRTSAPLALVRTAWGRCGEESTFTTTALRAVGIPARQCYTPRWVHSDDNHAWVEVWVDGQWHFMGACEPEAVLDAGWFAAPATLAMMVHTNVFGAYTGAEEKNLETPLYSKINLLANYAATRKVLVQVVDGNDQPVEGATVQFKVYNYAELYPISANTTDKNGQTSIMSGGGDLMIWANKQNAYGYRKSTKDETITVVKLDRKKDAEYDETYLMNIPQGRPIPKLPAELAKNNARRLAHGDSIRNAYIQTFATENAAKEIAAQYKLNSVEVWKYLKLAQGNWQEIKEFIILKKDHPDLFPFLATLSEKDLRDTPAAFLADHLQDRQNLKIKAGTPENMVVPYILSPRIELEIIQPWRSFAQSIVSASDQDEVRAHPEYIIDAIKKKVKLDNDENYYHCRLTPRGVYELGTADFRSRDICFVAACRSFGIPARLEPATYKPQYFENGQWTDAVFEQKEVQTTNLPKVKLTVQNDPSNLIKPSYTSHYTLAYFADGDFHTLDYEGSPAVATFPYSLNLDEGYYRLLAGSRGHDGSVTVYTKYFKLENGKPLTLSVKMPEVLEKLTEKGTIDMNTTVQQANGDKISLKQLSNGKGLMICILDPGKEPSKHILQDLPAAKQTLEEWGGGILLTTPDDKLSAAFDASAFKGLPKQIVWSTDDKRALLNTACNVLNTPIEDNFPLTIYLSDMGGILYSFFGYKIGMGEEIVKIIQKERTCQ